MSMSDEDTQRIVLRILARYIHSANLKVLLFGSLATVRASPRSDYDVGIDAGTPVDWSAMAQIRADLEDSDIPVRVDVVDLAACSDAFKSVALQGALAW